jgi:hypothetical protein
LLGAYRLKRLSRKGWWFLPIKIFTPVVPTAGRQDDVADNSISFEIRQAWVLIPSLLLQLCDLMQVTLLH